MAVKLEAIESGSLDSESLGGIDSVEADYDFFKKMLDTIPPSAYFDEDTKQQVLKKLDSDQESESEGEEQPLKTEKKNKDKKLKKKQKLDPIQNKTVSQIRDAMIESEDEEEPYSKIKEKNKHKKNRNKNKKLKKLATEKELAHTANRQELLREKLRARIEELQGKRGKLNIDEAIEKKKLKRKESKLKLKMRRKAEKNNKNKMNLGTNINGGIGSPKPKTPIKPVYNKQGKMVFSKFDFTDSGEKEKLNNELKGKDYKRLLEKIEKKQEKIKKLKEKDETAGKKLEEKVKWTSLLDKAQGAKIKDNPELLKKSLKRKEKLKQTRKKKWDIREKQTKQRIEKQQEKREKNIQARKKAKMDKKVERAKKKGRVVPGF